MTTDNDECNTNFIGPITDNIINSCIEEIKKEKNKKKIMKYIIEPILTDINNRYYPYIMTLVFILIIIITLLSLLLITNINENSKCDKS